MTLMSISPPLQQVLAILLHGLVQSWTATDRQAALPLLTKNLKANDVPPSAVDVQEVDWEDAAHLHSRKKNHQDLGWSSPDVVLAGVFPFHPRKDKQDSTPRATDSI